MTMRFEEFAESLPTLTSVGAVWKHTAAYSHALGFSNCTLTLAKKTPTGPQSANFFSNLDGKFCDVYSKEGLISDDPFLKFTCASLSAKKIANEGLLAFPNASAKHKIFLDITAQSGAPNGLGVPVRISNQDVFGGWIFSCTDVGDIFDLLSEERGQETQLAAVMAYERMVAIKLGEGDPVTSLSLREKECLLWLCAGFRSSMIADRLSISESAVNLYITNAKHKLGAKTREQAIARAIQSGEITI